jgi:hypothetical protein
MNIVSERLEEEKVEESPSTHQRNPSGIDEMGLTNRLQQTFNAAFEKKIQS